MEKTIYSYLREFEMNIMNSNDLSQPLVVLDLDMTIIGDISVLSLLDSIHFNIYNKILLNQEKFNNCFSKGLLRPKFKELVEFLLEKKYKIVIYTHSTKKWAIRVCEAIQNYIGINFISALFARDDCILPFFEEKSTKSLDHIVKKLQKMNHNVSLNKTIMFDDNNVLCGRERKHLKIIPKYGYIDLTLLCRYNDVGKLEINKNILNILINVKDNLYVPIFENSILVEKNKKIVDCDNIYINLKKMLEDNDKYMNNDNLYSKSYNKQYVLGVY